MLSLLIDIGNSTVVTAELCDGNIRSIKRYPTPKFSSVFKFRSMKNYTNVIVSSVVPAIDRKFKRFPSVFFVNHETIPRLTVSVDKPEQVGADRLVNALAAFTRYEQPVLVVDSGTATTFCMVNEKGCYIGGAIYPGMKIASKALRDFTAKIPLVLVAPQDTLVGKTTKDAVQVGLYFGSIHMINGMINHYRSKFPNLKVIGTGKGLSVLSSKIELDDYDPSLILKGLAYVAESM